MSTSKIESYNLSPDEYLNRFQTPHSVISHKGKQQKYLSDQLLLEEILSKYNQNNQTKQIKEKAISQLNIIVDKWFYAILDQWRIQKQAQSQKLTEKQQKALEEELDFQAKDLGYGLKIFGSYSLRTNSFDGDIDMICVVPQFFSRQKHFFTMLTEDLKKHPDIKEVFPIPDAIVPLIKLYIYDVQIDLLISRIPVIFLKDNPEFFQGKISFNNSFINDRQLRSINGYRTSLYLKKNIKNYKNYQVVLKAIKMWAKNKGIYSQIYGFLGGAALSIMLAKICQLYPNYSPLQLLDRFFFIYANWIWSMPVCIENCQIEQKVQGGMQVYTPLQPHMNAAHYVSRITCHVTRKYLRLASKLIQEINRKKKEWKDLFQPLNFFNTYNHFIEMSIMGEKLEQFILWKGNVESKIRKLIKSLENQIESLQLIEIHPYPVHFVSRHQNYKFCNKYYFGIKCQSNLNLDDYCEIDFTQSIRYFLELLENYSAIDKLPKELNIGFAHIELKDVEKEVINGVQLY